MFGPVCPGNGLGFLTALNGLVSAGKHNDTTEF